MYIAGSSLPIYCAHQRMTLTGAACGCAMIMMCGAFTCDYITPAINFRT